MDQKITRQDAQTIRNMLVTKLGPDCWKGSKPNYDRYSGENWKENLVEDIAAAIEEKKKEE
jgi:hypothetical protein